MMKLSKLSSKTLLSHGSIHLHSWTEKTTFRKLLYYIQIMTLEVIFIIISYLFQQITVYILHVISSVSGCPRKIGYSSESVNISKYISYIYVYVTVQQYILSFTNQSCCKTDQRSMTIIFEDDQTPNVNVSEKSFCFWPCLVFFFFLFCFVLFCFCFVVFWFFLFVCLFIFLRY